ncbi:MAG: substrate-binding domain-containing protein, partial [Chloroflexi bacterium]|nr:substrate-binding domain-containing protein [Chloroflexota bacterium]
MKNKSTQQFADAAVFCARMIVLFFLIASQFFGAAPQPALAVVYVDVGIVLPDGDDGRWHQDKARLEADLTAAGITSQVLFSNGNSVQEAANVNSLLAKNIKVLILCPVDGDAAAITVAAARVTKPSLKIIAYDRLIPGTPALNFFVTFDSIGVGEAQGQYLVDHAGAGSGKPLYLYAGSATDNNAFLFFQGAWSVLQPKIADGTFVIQNSSAAVAQQNKPTLTREEQEGIFAQIAVADWDPNNAGTLATTNLTTGTKGDVFILAPNDGTARAIADVFATDGGVSSYAITGQDAERDSVQYIIDGKQSMTVFKDTRTLADNTVTAAHAFIHNQPPTSNSTYYNGSINVPAWSTATVTVDQTNLKAALIDSGYYGCDFVSLDPLCQFILASVQNNWIQARKWPKGIEVKLEIDDLSNGLGSVDYTTTATMGDAPWNTEDPNESLAEFDMGSFKLEVGDVVSVSQNIVSPPVTKALTVSAFQVTSFNVAADTVSGTANTGANVDVCVNIPGNCIFRSVTATAGTWTVDFTADHDLQQGDNGWATEYDSDSDQTFYDWNVPNPHIQVRTNDDTIAALDWPMGTLLSLSINNPAPGATDYSTTKTVTETTPWGSGETYALFETGAFDIESGFIVSISGGGTTRTYTVTSLEITGFDLAANIVSGIAAPNSDVEIWACWDNGCTNNHQATADGSGNWSTDFTADHDIIADTWVDSAQWDGINNGTMFGQNAFEPNHDIISSPDFSADFTADKLHGYGWPLGNSVSLTIDGASVAGVGPQVVGGTIGHTTLLFDLGGFDLQPGQVVSMTDGANTETHTLTGQSVLSVGFIQMGPESDYEWRTTNTASFVDTAEQQGLPLKRYFGQYQQANQLWALNQFIQDPDVNVIVLTPTTMNGWGSILQAAQAAGKMVILQDRTVNASDTLYATHVTTDFTEEGRKAGTEMCNLLAGSPSKNVVELVGSPSEVATDRAAGFRQIVKSCGITITRSQTANFDRDEGRQVIAAWLQQSTNIQGVFAHNDEMGLGAIQAIKDHGGLLPGNDIKIVSIDGISDALAALDAGELNASVECTPRMAPAVFTAALQKLNGQTIPKTIFVQETVYRETVHPSVKSIVVASANPTSASSVDFTVTFSKAVTDVDTADFKLTSTLLTGVSVTGVTGSGDTYTVTVNTGKGNGTIRLDVPGTASIYDLAAHAIINPYTDGEVYTVSKGIAPTVPVLKLPAKNTLVTNTPTLDWSDSSEVLALAVPGWHYEINVTSPQGYNETFNTVDDPDPLVGLGTSQYTFTTPLPDNTTFTWKVRAYNDQNQYSAWSAPFTFRTKLGTPVLNLPANSTLLDNKRPTFTWDAVPGAATYTLQILKGTAVVNTGTITAPAHVYTPAVDLLPDTLYSWKVKANGTNAGDYSAPFTFTTSPNPPAVPVLTSPANALLVDGAVAQTLKWNPVTTSPVAASFQVEYSTNSAFSGSTFEVVNSNTLGETQLSLAAGTLSPNLTYYWRVRSWSGADADGSHSAWSLTRNFRVKPETITTKLPAPDLTSPVDNAAQVVKRPTFTWTEVSGASSYTLQILKGTTVVNTGTIVPPLHSYVPKADLLAGTTYTWKVKANGTIPSDFSTPFTFTVVPNPPKVPTLTLPASNALLDSAAVQILKWNPVPAVTTTVPSTSYPAAASFEVEYAANNYFSGSTVEIVSSGTQLSLPAGTFLPNLTYYWRVRSWSETGAAGSSSAWTVARTFRTKLETPVLNLPVNWALLDNKRPTFEWDEVPGATGYTLQILKGTTVVNTGTISSPAYVYTPLIDLLPSTVYTWKVKANGVNAGDYSAPFTFTTSANPPKPPVLTAPANAAVVDSAVAQVFKWNPPLAVTTTSPATTYPLAQSYDVQYATNLAFTNSITVNVSTTQTSPIPLLPGRTYYWRVRSWSGINGTGDHSSWSLVRTVKVKF